MRESPLRRFASSPLRGNHASSPAKPVPRRVLERDALRATLSTND